MFKRRDPFRRALLCPRRWHTVKTRSRLLGFYVSSNEKGPNITSS